MTTNEPTTNDETPKKTRVRKKGAAVNKAQEIRRAARQLVAQGKPPRPKVIKEILEAEGIEVSSAQVSTALADSEFAFRRNRDGWDQLHAAENLNAEPVSLKELNAAEQFAKTVGGQERALAAVVALGKLKKDEPAEHDDYYGGA
jgi:hypothetical protein